MRNKGLIGISGKKNSGKDLIAKIIQYLVYQNSHKGFELHKSLSEFLKSSGLLLNFGTGFPIVNVFTASGYRNVKFGDKLKDIVSLLIGCSRQNLEDREFKERELGEEWWCYKGKDNTLIPYKPGDNMDDENLIKPTPRLLLQLLGTECGRKILHPNIWVNSAFSTPGQFLWNKESNMPEDTHKLIFTDVRFPNEFKAIKERGGINIRIERFQCGDFVNYVENDTKSTEIYRILNCFPNHCTATNSQETKSFFYECLRHSDGDKHPSETALDNCKYFDYTIYNVGSIEDLVEKVQKILETEKII